MAALSRRATVHAFISAILPGGLFLCGVPPLLAGPHYEPVNAFSSPPAYLSGGNLWRHTDGKLYGTSYYGGAYGAGTLYAIDPVEKSWATVLSFGGLVEGSNPQSGLIADDFGWLWGTTSDDQSSPRTPGTVFRFHPATRQLITVLGKWNPLPGTAPRTTLARDSRGWLWGTAGLYQNFTSSGIVFKINPVNSEVVTMARFTGYQGSLPGGLASALVNDGAGSMWGTTGQIGTTEIPGIPMKGALFKIHEQTGVFTSNTHFTGNGGTGLPTLAPLVADGQGFLWGVTDMTSYKVNIATGEFTHVLTFTNQSGTAQGAGINGPLWPDGAGSFYGSAQGGGPNQTGIVYKLTDPAGTYTKLGHFGDYNGHNASAPLLGIQPISGLVPDGLGLLWGVTQFGTSEVFGSTAYTVDLATDTIAPAIIFSHPTGSYPMGGLVEDAHGWLWGVASAGGTYGLGTIFKVSPHTGELAAVSHFSGNSGRPAPGKNAYYSLTKDANGILWGVTGTSLFKVEPSTGTHTNLVSLPPVRDLNGPWEFYTPLCVDSQGNLWGAMAGGGAFGSIYKADPDTGALTIVSPLPGYPGVSAGNGRISRLTADGLGWLWGVNHGQGRPNYGTIFKIHETTHEFVTVVRFTGPGGSTPGSSPCLGLVQDAGGYFWGLTGTGEGPPTMFKIEIATGAFTSVANLGFTSPGAVDTLAPLTIDSQGVLWGTVAFYDFRSGPAGYGTVFKFTPAGEMTEVAVMTGRSGKTPGMIPSWGGLCIHSNGSIYGTTDFGGSYADGTPAGNGQIYRLRFAPTATTLDATAVGQTSGTLQGRVDPCGKAVDVAFEYASHADFRDSTMIPAGMMEATAAARIFSASVRNLRRGTTYYYRILANESNASTATEFGRVLSFITLTRPMVEFASATYSARERDRQASISIIRRGDLSKPATLMFATIGGTAQPFQDYNPQWKKLSFSPGESQKTIVIPISDDHRSEPVETVGLLLFPPSVGTSLGTQNQAVLSISGP